MIIALSNNSKGFESTEILVNTDFIVSVFEGKDEDGNSSTFIFSSLNNTWTVKETVAEVYTKCRGIKTLL
jgi:hypothetical protein